MPDTESERSTYAVRPSVETHASTHAPRAPVPRPAGFPTDSEKARGTSARGPLRHYFRPLGSLLLGARPPFDFLDMRCNNRLLSRSRAFAIRVRAGGRCPIRHTI